MNACVIDEIILPMKLEILVNFKVSSEAKLNNWMKQT